MASAFQPCCPQCRAQLASVEGKPASEHVSPELVAALPERVAHRYLEAWRVQSASPTACAILVGSTLEAICAHEHLAGSTLPEKITALAQRKRLPTLLVDIAHALRYLRNIGSHEAEETIGPEDIPAMLAGLQALVSYLYLLPLQRMALEEHLQQHLEERRGRLAQEEDERIP
jgi:uncharacterized protein DUF4145